MSTQTLLKTLLRYKTWANEELFNLLRAVPADSPASDLHRAVRLLNHTYVVDRIFAAHLQGQRHGYTALNTPETPTLAELHEAVRASDRGLEDYVATLTEAELETPLDFAFVDGTPGRMTRGEMLMHLITHGNFHRGMVTQIIAQRGIETPRDVLTVFLHRGDTTNARQ